MLIVIAIMLAGILTGYLLRKNTFLKRINRPIFITILALLFLMGLSVGGNPEITNHLHQVGTQALILATAGTLGSVLAAMLVYRFFFRKDLKNER